MNLNDCSPSSTPKERSLLWSSRSLNCSLETLGENEGNEMKFSSIGEEEAYIPIVKAQMTLLPSLLQPNHYNAITKFRGQKCPSTSKKKSKSNNWHESECEDKFSQNKSHINFNIYIYTLIILIYVYTYKFSFPLFQIYAV